jgi:hypothetical protein
MNPTCPSNQCGKPRAVCGTALDTGGWNGDACWRLGRRWRPTLLPPPRWLPVASVAPPSLASPSLSRRYICPWCRQGSVAAWAWRRRLPIALLAPAHQDLAGAHGQPLLPSSRPAPASSLLADRRPPRAQGDWSPVAARRARLVAARSSSTAPPPADVRTCAGGPSTLGLLRASVRGLGEEAAPGDLEEGSVVRKFGGGKRRPGIWGVLYGLPLQGSFSPNPIYLWVRDPLRCIAADSLMRDLFCFICCRHLPCSGSIIFLS